MHSLHGSLLTKNLSSSSKKRKQAKRNVSPGTLECPPEHTCSPENEKEVVVGGLDEEQRRADLVVDE